MVLCEIELYQRTVSTPIKHHVGCLNSMLCRVRQIDTCGGCGHSAHVMQYLCTLGALGWGEGL